MEIEGCPTTEEGKTLTIPFLDASRTCQQMLEDSVDTLGSCPSHKSLRETSWLAHSKVTRPAHLLQLPAPASQVCKVSELSQSQGITLGEKEENPLFPEHPVCAR